ncbi:hypothetical protein [Pedobacter sp. UBA5917]|nr:hypothetical protein [Pedobacter sp. UBA5917]
MMKSSHIYFSFKRALTGVSGLGGGNNFTIPQKYYASRTNFYNPKDA